MKSLLKGQKPFLASCEDGEESPKDSPRRISCSSPRSGRSRMNVDVLKRRWCFDCSICDWEYKLFSFLWRKHLFSIEPSGVDFRCVHLLQLFNVCYWSVCFPDSLRVQCTSEEYTWQDFWTKLMQCRLVFRRNRVIFDHCSKRYYWSVKWYPEPPLM